MKKAREIYTNLRRLITELNDTISVLRVRRKKLLIGVTHANEEEELEKIKNIINKYSPSKVGVELPEDYLKREMYGVSTFFFSPLASYLRNSGIDVIPLESPELWEYFNAVQLALAVRKGKISKEKIETELALLKLRKRKITLYTAPEVVYEIILYKKRYETALKILNETSTLEETKRVWEECNTQRENYMLSTIIKTRPEVVVVGDAHARKLKEKLPEYKYVRVKAAYKNPPSSAIEV